MDITGTPSDDIIDSQAGDALKTAQTPTAKAEARDKVEVAQGTTRSDVGITNEEANAAAALRSQR